MYTTLIIIIVLVNKYKTMKKIIAYIMFFISLIFGVLVIFDKYDSTTYAKIIRRTPFMVTFEFIVDNKTYRNSFRVRQHIGKYMVYDSLFGRTYNVGDMIKIKYKKDNPNFNRRPINRPLIFFGLIIILAGLVLQNSLFM